MKRSIWLRIGLAAGLAILLVLTLLGIILAAPDAPQAITFDLAPMPPQSIVPGMSETFTWTVTGGTPIRVEFEVLYPSGAVADSQTYPGSTGLSVVRLYTVPPGAPTGLYTSTVRYFRSGSGTLQALGNFCVAERGNLRVFKFEDINGNGVQDAGEGPVAGIEIQIRPVAGSLCPSEASSQFTGPDGYATWHDIAIGQYIVSEVLPACWRVTREPTNPVTVMAQMTTEVTFANQRLGALQALKFEDANGNNTQDVGEGAVQGVTITVRSPDGSIATKLTDANGHADWSGIPVGSYRITETLPIGWKNVSPLATTAPVNFCATTGVVFANRRIGNLHVFKFADANGNGIRDTGENPVQGISIAARDPDGMVTTMVTDLGGRADWNNVPIGSYLVTETLPAGWRATLPSAASATVDFNATTDVTFANQQIGNLHVFKFADANGNGIRDTGENPVQGVSIVARDPGGKVDTKVTDVSGRADWNNVPIGSYLVTETLPAGWRPILPPTAAATVGFNATTDVTFANQQLGNLHVFKFEDVDGNGVRNGAEGPVQGVIITVRGPRRPG